ncbi:hypothetical protein DB347_13290 [Opitutaceae bacterium EW11]|nr:hypothetical protein DB347_13290 [Opitutaceae bacterium EW11]
MNLDVRDLTDAEWATAMLPCGPDCRYFRRIGDDPGGSWGYCEHPRLAHGGAPVSEGRDCTKFEPGERDSGNLSQWSA